MLDVATALDRLVPAAAYRGSLTANDRAAYEALVWLDDTPQPAWEDVEAMMAAGVVVPDAAPKLALVRAMRLFQMDGQPVTDPAVQVSVWQTVQGALAGADPTVREDWELLTEVPRRDPIMLGLVAGLPFPPGVDADGMADTIYRVAEAIDEGRIDPYTGAGLVEVLGG